jgi:hypothetical protein
MVIVDVLAASSACEGFCNELYTPCTNTVAVDDQTRRVNGRQRAAVNRHYQGWEFNLGHLAALPAGQMIPI